MQEVIIEIMQQYGYFGIFALILLENIFPPIPSEIILSFSGFMINSAGLSLIMVVIVSTLGSVTGAIILYKIGTKLNKHKIREFVKKYGHIFRIKGNDVDKTLNMYKKHEHSTVFYGRMIPIIRSLISVPAGMARMNMASFIIFTAAGSLLWNSVIIVAGMFLGSAWHDIVKYTGTYSKIAYVLIAVVIVIIFIVLKRRKA